MVEVDSFVRRFLLHEDGKTHSSELGNLDELNEILSKQGWEVIRGYVPRESIEPLLNGFNMYHPIFTSTTKAFLEKGYVHAVNPREKDRPGFCVQSGTNVMDKSSYLYKNISEKNFLRNWTLANGSLKIYTRRAEGIQIPNREETATIERYRGTDIIMAQVGFRSLEQANQFPGIGEEISAINFDIFTND